MRSLRIHLMVMQILFGLLLVGCGASDVNPNQPPVGDAPLAAPTALSGTPALDSVLLRWQDNSGGIADIQLERREGVERFSVLTTVHAGVNWYVDDTIAEGLSYQYRIRANYESGASDYSEISAFTLTSVESSGGQVGASRGVHIIFEDGAVAENIALPVAVDTTPSQPYRMGVNALGPSTKFLIPQKLLSLDQRKTISMIVPRFAHIPETDDNAFDYAAVFLSSEREDGYGFLYAPYDRTTGETVLSTSELQALADHYGLPDLLEVIVEPVDISGWSQNQGLSSQANTDEGLYSIDLRTYNPNDAAANCDQAHQNATGIAGIRLAQPASGSKPPLILVHGWQALGNYQASARLDFDSALLYAISPRDRANLLRFSPQVCDWLTVLRAFRNSSMDDLYDIYTFAYDSDLSVDSNARRLNGALRKFEGGPDITFLGYSMGGMVINAYLHKYGTANLNHVITLGTPFRGTSAFSCIGQGAACSKVKLIFDEPEIALRIAPIIAAGGTKAAAAYSLLKSALRRAVTLEGTRNLALDHPGLVTFTRNTTYNFDRYTSFYGIQTIPTVPTKILEISAVLLSLKRGSEASDGIVPIDSAQMRHDSWARIKDTRGISGANHFEVKNSAAAITQFSQLLREILPSQVEPEPVQPEPPSGPTPPAKNAPGSFSLTQAEPYCTAGGLPGVRLVWGESQGAAAYDVLRDGAVIYELATLHPRFENVTNLAAGGRYEYVIRARNSVGDTTTPPRNVLIPTDICETGNPPGEPTPGAGALAITPLGGFSAESVIGTLPSPNSTDYTLTNTGAGTLNWSVSSTVDWLTVNPSSGSLAPSEKVTVGVRINVAARNLRPGSHAGTVRFSADGPISGSSERTVTLALADLPPDPTIFSKLEASPTSIAFHGEVGERPSSRTITLTNSGRADSNYQVSYPGWLDVTPYSGSLASGRSTTVQIRPVRCERRETLTGLIQFRDQDSLANVSVSMECSNAEPTTGMLRISTSGVPTGYRKAFGTVTGPNGYYEEIDVSDISLSIPAGTYTVQMDGFRYGNDRYFADVSRRSVQVNVGRTSQVSFRYEKEITLPVTELLSNRSFDRTNNWSISGDAWVWNGGTENKYHSPSGYAALGVDRNGYAKSFASGDITQEVVIPAGAKTGRVSFYYQMDVISTTYGSDFTIALYAGRCSSNYALVRGGRALQARDARSSYTFVQSTTFDVADLVGSTVCFRLSGGTSAGEQIVLRLDDVSLTVWGN